MSSDMPYHGSMDTPQAPLSRTAHFDLAAFNAGSKARWADPDYVDMRMSPDDYHDGEDDRE